MKRIVSVILSLVFICSNFVACSDTNKGTSVKNFVENYTSYNVDDSYYETHELDYHTLYDISLGEPETSYEFGDWYEWVLCSSVFGKTGYMTANTDTDGNIEGVQVVLRSSVLNLFYTSNELEEYYGTVLKSVIPDMTLIETINIVKKAINSNIYVIDTEQGTVSVAFGASDETAIFRIDITADE